MRAPAPLKVLLIADPHDPLIQPLRDDLAAHSGLALDADGALPRQLSAYDVVLVCDPARLAAGDAERLERRVRDGGGAVGLLRPAPTPLAPLWGAQLGAPGPTSELRLALTDAARPLARRLPESLMVRDMFLPIQASDAGAAPLLTTIWQYERAALALMREVGDGRAICLSLQRSDSPLVRQLIYRLIRAAARREEPAPLGVAVLGYGPSDAVGYRHGVAVSAVPGLEFRAACDHNAQRLVAAREEFPGLRTYTDGRALAEDDAVDVVIIATPPNSHAKLAIEMLRAGKHVVCEKPLCISRAEADAMIAAAAEAGRVLTTHQNRRWDADFLAIRQAVEAGLIGAPFYLETFVGGFFHPCDYWHSHAPISGGALYDWGAHYVDSILQLFGGPLAAVRSVAHKRVWHDVTNADQERVQLLFADGREAEFLYSEVAAIRKPKWYLLGGEGAIVADWNEMTLLQPHRTAFYSAQEVPVTEAPPRITLRRRMPAGDFVDQALPTTAARPYPFHHNLADHLLSGEPLAVQPGQSARVVQVLEAAARSARRGGAPEPIDG